MTNMSAKDQLWAEAAKRYRLSNEHMRMARELGMNPKKLGGLANHKQEPWKVPLPQFIEELYESRFRKKKTNVGRPAARAPEGQKGTAVCSPAPEADDNLPF